MNGRNVHLKHASYFHDMGKRGFCTYSNKRSFINELLLKNIKDFETFNFYPGCEIKKVDLKE